MSTAGPSTGEWVSIDGGTGEVLAGEIPTRPSEILQVVRGEKKPEDSRMFQYFSKLLSWADEFRKLGVRANSDTPVDARTAFAFGAEGIGLARTEHMFFGPERLPIVKEMILADNEPDRRRALDKLLPFQRKDFYEFFKEMHGNPVTIRTIDPPLHEFLPRREDLMVELASQINPKEQGQDRRGQALLARQPVQFTHAATAAAGRHFTGITDTGRAIFALEPTRKARKSVPRS
jgi:pyruvate,orthophosphate dikinase